MKMSFDELWKDRRFSAPYVTRSGKISSKFGKGETIKDKVFKTVQLEQ
jgi:hypothetical protein